MKFLVAFIVSLLFANSASAGGFSIGFDWSGLRRCTSGRPNVVGNPAFTLANVPAGTKWIYFKLTDLDVPTYNHGGGWIAYNGESVTKAGVFRYNSPCPPNGTHIYEWQATATDNRDSLQNPLGIARATRPYPD